MLKDKVYKADSALMMEESIHVKMKGALDLSKATHAKVFASQQEEFDLSQLVIMASPFLRTVQMANEIVGELEKHFLFSSSQLATTISIKLECAIWEIDEHNCIDHRSLPSPNGQDMSVIIEERHQYFPCVDRSYQSLFIPDLPGKSID
jgi:hypothetical protein